jgi:NAD(P)-dependent dehydrogenase (short-subunit alcohol dehydrogenase family)
MDLKDKAVLITGGSKGLGAALARGLADRGARVVITARHGAELDDVAADIRARGGEAHAVISDIGDKQSIYPLAGTAAALVGPIDVLVHNASTLGPTPLKLLLDTDCEELERVLDVNVVGPFRLSKVVAGSMALRGSGVIVHVSSDASVNAYPTWGAYSVSKAALDHMARLWAAELGELGVRAFAVDPGEMDTDMHRDALPDANRAELARPDDVAERIVRMIETAHATPNGARLEASKWKEAS